MGGGIASATVLTETQIWYSDRGHTSLRQNSTTLQIICASAPETFGYA